MKEVVIIGGGAAGMLCAIAAVKNGAKVTLVEQNEKLGKKLYITGKGRCNVTNIADQQEFLDNVSTNASFLYSSLALFNNYDMMALLDEAGVATKIERGGRVFPVSDKSSDVINGLQRILVKSEVNIMLNTRVIEIIVKSGKAAGVKTSNGIINCPNIVVCTGGMSYKLTGSTGDGYDFAKKLGHDIVKLSPSLVPLRCNDFYLSMVQGLSLKNIRLVCEQDGKQIYNELGEMLFTHFGVSGPLVLSLSAVISKINLKDLKFYIDLKPALDEDVLDKRLLREFAENKNKLLINILPELLPRKMIEPFALLCFSSIDGLTEKSVANAITKEQRLEIGKLLKHLPLTVTGLRNINEAVITQGGVSVKQINPKTMESKVVTGLYFAGEVLDVDALTGGYNLQIAFSTGYCAGHNSSL